MKGKHNREKPNRKKNAVKGKFKAIPAQALRVPGG
jgi:hypothetical protein